MTAENFDDLLFLIRDQITQQETYMRIAISPEPKLATILKYLATDNTFIIHEGTASS